MENIQKLGLSNGLQGWIEGGDVFLEAFGVGCHTAYSLCGASRLDVTWGLWKKGAWGETRLLITDLRQPSVFRNDEFSQSGD